VDEDVQPLTYWFSSCDQFPKLFERAICRSQFCQCWAKCESIYISQSASMPNFTDQNL